MEDELLVTIKQGKLRGIRKISSYSKKEYFSFLGIPYAEPPVGKLRFKPPVAASPWKGMLDATRYRNDCLQYSLLETEIVGDEDCLYLNVNTPEAPCKITTLKSVIVYIHPGAYTFGSGSMSGSGDFVMHQDIVHVTLNLRLHVFGFLNLGIEECPGNVGLRDIIMALKWIKENIRAFGGDPNNVTVFGSSSGSISIHYLMLTKQAEGLFHRAIMQCGIATSSSIDYHEDPIKLAKTYARLLGCKKQDSKKIHKFLMKKSSHELLLGQLVTEKLVEFSNLGKLTVMPFMPSVELIKKDAIIPEDLKNRLDNFINPVPVIFGMCEHEFVYMLNDLHYAALQNQLPMVIKKIFWHYDLDDKIIIEIIKRVRNKFFKEPKWQENLTLICDQFYNQILYSELYSTFIDLLLKHPQPSIYMYMFTYKGKLNAVRSMCDKMGLSYTELKGTFHGDDSCYWIADFPDYIPKQNTTEAKVIETMGRLFTNFAKTGNPNNGTVNGTHWMTYSKENPCYLNFGSTLKMEKGRFLEEDLSFWDDIYQYIRDAKLKK